VNNQHFDVLIIGAGLSGIDVACHLAQSCPDKSVALLERRQAMGGTWDLFRYPGIRSDSDMFTFGYPFRPWHDPRTLANGTEIRDYIGETARQFGVDRKIQYGVKVLSAQWCSQRQQWRLVAQHEATGETRSYTCRFLVSCTGYYNHDQGFQPRFPGEDAFKGLRIHPQHWPENLDYAGKRVVVIGSGATAVTLVPAMAEKAAHITMLQRSPSYVVSMPGVDGISALLKRFLPDSVVYRFARKRNLALQRGVYLACRRWPKLMRRVLLSMVRKQVGNDIDMRHFTPNYLPWEQRVCVVPDGDLFEKLKSGKASIVTDTIESFTQHGIRLTSGQMLQADIIITATGLNLQMLGGMSVEVDGEPTVLNELMTYKGVLLQNVPNMACLFGHANTPWTLKVDLAARYLCRLLQHMDATGQAVVVARDSAHCALDSSILGVLSSGYIQRGDATLPRQGGQYPWQVTQHLGKDTDILLQQPIADQWLQFSAPSETAPSTEALACG
jgi:monooxygenase